MPELPEVETVVRDLRPYLKGKVISRVDVRLPKMVKMSLRRFQRLVRGKKIVAVERRGKMILIKLANGQTLVIHLKMTGQLIYVSKNGYKQKGGHDIANGDKNLPNKYTHVIFKLRGSNYLYFNDLRQFGYLLLWPTDNLEKFFQEKKLGIEPFAKSFTFEYLSQALRSKKKSTIKAALLDQSIVAGLGNIYTDEALFQSKIKPMRRVKTLKNSELQLIVKNSRRVLKKAISQRGTTIRNYRGGLGQPGGMLKHLMVYGRSGKLCLRCRKAKIKKIRLGSRSSHFCPNCQK
ncbi:MAG: bifunctional DNA-formamidopyrimidine glycosylase/DNA-(apurinic or apyrimidinic site) lyase [Patescibacteria group bacterium]|nr:bifunctional DNA-formamidopyrimidine glycosylase/DNA-(apurinic or apyrimidinic site) lyase [Patescibacteria group bacterium]